MRFRYSKERILVADKSKGFLSVTKSLLEVAGFSVKTAKNAKEALGQIKKFKYDLLILGVVKPRIDGIRLLQMVRKSKIYADVPVLFVSEYPDKDELIKREEEIAEKAQGHIQKPFMTKTFLEMVVTLLERNGTVAGQRI
jgi:CheY-like chemotaxis protein